MFSSAIVAMSPLWPNLAKQTGIDFVFVDTEHMPIDRQTLSWICQTYQALGLPPVVRIPCNDPFEACKVLDAGAGGVIGPYVETAEQVRGLVGAVKLRPAQGPALAGGPARPQHAGAGAARLSRPAQRRQDPHRQHRERAGHREPARDLLGARTRRGAHRPARSVVQPGHSRSSTTIRASTRPTAPSSASPASTASGPASTSGSAWSRKSPGPKAGGNLVMHSSDLAAFSRTLKSEIEHLRKALDNRKAP